jgi:hypothetical protein
MVPEVLRYLVIAFYPCFCVGFGVESGFYVCFLRRVCMSEGELSKEGRKTNP